MNILSIDEIVIVYLYNVQCTPFLHYYREKWADIVIYPRMRHDAAILVCRILKLTEPFILFHWDFNHVLHR